MKSYELEELDYIMHTMMKIISVVNQKKLNSTQVIVYLYLYIYAHFTT